MLKRFLPGGSYSIQVNIAILTIRVVAGICMFTHGYGKLLKFFDDAPIEFADPIGLGQATSLALTVFAEAFCSVLLIVGLFTRFAALPLLITMFVIIFLVHFQDGFKKMELPLFYAVCYFSLLLTGGGKYSMDTILFSKESAK